MLSKVSVGTKCLDLETIPRDLLIFEEINNICCFQVRGGGGSIDEKPKVFNIVIPI